jgi:hypothetical protein
VESLAVSGLALLPAALGNFGADDADLELRSTTALLSGISSPTLQGRIRVHELTVDLAMGRVHLHDEAAVFSSLFAQPISWAHLAVIIQVLGQLQPNLAGMGMVGGPPRVWAGSIIVEKVARDAGYQPA